MTARVNYKQLGVSGLRRYSGYVYEEFLPELRWPRAGKLYQEMSSNDPVIGSILYLAEMLIRGTTWSVKPASDSAEDKEAAKFLEDCMNDMEASWADIICEILSMLTYGFSFHEIVYKVRRGPDETSPKYRSKYTDGRIGWRNLPVRAQTSLEEWEFDEEGYVTAFVQCCEPLFKQVTIPMSKGLLFRTRVSKDNPEGRSLLRNAYRPWFFKKHFEEIEGIGIERDLAGFPVLTTPENVDLWNKDDPNMVQMKADAEALVSSVRRDAQEGLLLPFGWDLKLLSANSSRQINIGETIERYDKRIAITMLSDLVLLGEKSGSFALADTKQSTLAAALQAQLLSIADVFNKNAVPRLFALNSMDLTNLPEIMPGQIQSPSLKELSLLLRAMGTKIAGDKELMNYIRRIACLPMLEDDVFEEVYKPQASQPTPGQPGQPGKPAGDKKDDTAENTLEQSDMHYTGTGDAL